MLPPAGRFPHIAVLSENICAGKTKLVVVMLESSSPQPVEPNRTAQAKTIFIGLFYTLESASAALQGSSVRAADQLLEVLKYRP